MENARNEIINKIRAIEDLPSFPPALTHLNTEMNKPEIDLAAVSRTIESDPALAAYILKIVNSAYYIAIQGGIFSINQALMRIGFSEVRKLASPMEQSRCSWTSRR